MLNAPPARTRQVRVHRDVRIPAPGGVSLLTDLYLTGLAGPQPTVLIRTPYGRRGTSGGLGRLFAERGYHAAVQSTRGTAGSGGEIDFSAEAADGRAAADWITGQPWSSGDIAGYGASYLSFAQYALASTRPPQLRALAVGVCGADRRAGYYPGGSFALERALGWAYIVNSKGMMRAAAQAKRALAPAFGHLPLISADEVAVGRAVPFYRAWLEHDAPGDPYWAATDFRGILPDLGMPVTMLAGWYDVFLPYMLADYRMLRDSGQDVRLRIGAWPHASRPGAAHGLRDAFALFDAHLRGQPARPAPPVQIEVMGGGWRDLPDWPPPARTERWHLHPDGVLAPAVPPVSEPDRYRYDPADPTPAVGGSSLSISAGPKDNRDLERRPDVLTYTSAPLGPALEIIGPVTADLHVSSSLGHTDFFARLCDVDRRGRSVNITDGLIRLRPGDPAGRVRVDLWPTAHRFRPGHRIRLQVSSGAHPRYARNPGTGEPLATATTLRRADQAIHHDPQHPSAVLLPVLTGG